MPDEKDPKKKLPEEEAPEEEYGCGGCSGCGHSCGDPREDDGEEE